MKKYIIALILTLAGTSSLFSLHVVAATADSVSTDSASTTAVYDIKFDADAPQAELWKMANQAYVNGQYDKSVALYTAILTKGVHSSKLYYNLGNAYFKQDKWGGAILNYKRALLLSPADEDARHNLKLASSRTVDRIDTVPEFFVKSWLRSLGLLMGTDGWTILALSAFAICLALVLVWLFVHIPFWKRMGFAGACVALCVTGCSFVYAQMRYSDIHDGAMSVVMSESVNMKSSPAVAGKDLSVLHQGTIVKMGEQLDGWVQITLSDGNVGWVENRDIEKI